MPPQATPCSGCGARATDRQDFGWHITCLHIAGASAVRLGLAWLGVGPSLQDRIEIATPLTSLTRLREGLFLMQYGSSPYAGSAYHAAPLLLPLLGSTASHPILYILPGLVADALAALSLAHLQRQLTRGSTRPAVGYSLAALYLWNPLAILACCGGSSAPLENAAGLFALASAVAVNAPFAAFGIVCAAYLSLHPLTLMVPIAVLLWKGPELLHDLPPGTHMQAAVPSPADVATPSPSSRPTSSHAESGSPGSPNNRPPASNTTPAATQKRLIVNSMASNSSSSGHSMAGLLQARYGRRQALRFWAFALIWAAALCALSDIFLRDCPGHGNSIWVRAYGSIPGRQVSGAAGGQHSMHSGSAPGAQHGSLAASKHWTWEVYGHILLVKDNTPNIGLYWYLFTQMFPEFRIAALVFLHTAALLFTVPLSWRFRHRPLFACVCQLIINALFKPYPSIGDIALYMALLPLFTAQLARLQSSLFLVNGFLLLSGLGPAMWHLWMHVGSANANFFYAITLLLGAWQVLLLAQLLGATLECDWQLQQASQKQPVTPEVTDPRGQPHAAAVVGTAECKSSGGGESSKDARSHIMS